MTSKYRDLNASPRQQMSEIVAGLNATARQPATGSFGQKHMGVSGDLTWTRDGRDISVREVDEALEAAQGRIDEAAQGLIETGERLDAAEQTVEAVRGDLTTLETVTLPGAVADLEAADQAAQEALGGLEERLGDFATDETLAPIREALADAQKAVETAQSVAETANQAANAASQAALEAAGIAASKGRTIIQEAEPQGEDRNAANIWIKPVPDNPDTEAEERATTYVYIEESDEWIPTTSDELAQAAQNALDAREAAQQAQQRAEAAIANAEAAQGAAEAAQRTADQATTDAREAHNAAVEAADTAAAIRADMASGPTLWEDPSFERGMGPLPGPYAGRIERSQEWAASGEWSVKYIATGSGGNNYGTYMFGDLTPGHWYAVSVTVHAGEHEQGWNTTWDARTAPTQSADNLGYVIVGDNGKITVGPGETKTDTWFFQAPEGGVAYRFWAGQPTDYNKAEHEGQVVYVDDFRLVDVTDSYPQYLAAQKAAEDAQARADEAYSEAASKATPAEVEAAASAAEKAATEAASADATAKAAAAESAAKTAAAADAKAKADQALADAKEAADAVAASKAGEARTAAEAEAKRLADIAEQAAKDAAAADATAKANQAKADAAADAKAKADQALKDALAALATARGEITAEIKASANGKNSITVSTSAPTSSTPGVVAGDTWWRVDGSGDIYGQWAWNGNQWTARQIRSEVIANLDVHKLQVTGSAKMDEAVIDKLFAETFAAHKITASELLVSGSMNLIPGVRPGSNYGLSDFTWDEDEKALRATGRTGIYSDESFTLPPGEYLVSADIKASVDGTRTYVGLLGGDDVDWRFRYGISNVAPTTEWQHFEAGLSIPEGDEGSAKLRVLPAYSGDDTATTWYRNISLRPMTGAVLIEDGAITTPKLTVTEDMSAAIVNAMSVNTKKLVVSEEAILNHATLIGQTVVDDINVQGKLIGNDGVFTGTVDFANVNVTGTQIVNKLGASSISADKIAGGSFSGQTFEGGMFVGGVFATNMRPSTDGGLSINATNGLRAWNSSGKQTVSIDPINGDLRMGAGVYLTGSDRNGLVLNPPSGIGTASIYFTQGEDMGANSAAIWRLGYSTGRSPLKLRGANGEGIVVDGANSIFEGNVDVNGNFGVIGTTTQIGYLIFPRPPGTSQTANVYMNPTNGVIARSSSSRRYKRSIEDWEVDAETVLSLQPRRWQAVNPMEGESEDDWFVGMVAEEVEEAGLPELVSYDAEGRADGLHYPVVAVAQQAVLRKHEDEIADLRARVEQLEGARA